MVRGSTVIVSPRTSLKRAYDRIPKKESRIIQILGIVMFFTSLMLIPPVIVAAVNSDGMLPFVIPMIAGLVLSTYMMLRYVTPNSLRPADGLMMMFSLWILLFVFGTIPYLIYGFDFVDSIFESVSGFTTTGATTVVRVTDLPDAMILWRSITTWIGGIIIVMMFMFLIPMVVSGGRGLLKNEMSGSGGGNLSMKLGTAAKQFITVYVILTALFTGVLLVQGVSLLDSSCLAMSSISIGGFMSTDDSMASFPMSVKISVIFFLLISASNFYLHFRAIFKGDVRGYGRSEEFKVMIVWFLLISLMIILQALVGGSWSTLPGSDADKVVDVFFSVVSVGTTAGMSTVEYTNNWIFLDVSIFMLMMFIGGSAGSASGGVKISRVIITMKALVNEIRQQVHPNAVYTVRYNGEGVSSEAVHSSMVIIVVFLVTTAIGSAFYNMTMTLDDAVYLSVAMITNTGTASGAYFANFSTLPAGAKLFSCIMMFLGRMEILAILAIFTPGFWVEFLGRGEINKAKARVSLSGVRKRRKDGGVSRDPVQAPEVPEAPQDT